MSLPSIDETHAPNLESWVPDANGHADFPIQNLPLGVFSRPGKAPRPGVAIGDHIVDLSAIGALLPAGAAELVTEPQLNRLLATPIARRALRRRLSELLSQGDHRAIVAPALTTANECKLHLPAAIGDYTDFYVGIHHATNVGRLFRPDNPLLPNYKYVPIGYHGRASTVQPSGVPVVRPFGQSQGPDNDGPRFGPSMRLDYELELGIWIGSGNEQGKAIPIGAASGHIAGICLLNDWSTRDIQAWEYAPLGPFLSKNFHTSISPWVVTAEALAPFRTSQPERPAGDPTPLPYLWDDGDQSHGALALTLHAAISSAQMRSTGIAPLPLSAGPATNMYWTMAQIVTHHASNGCSLNPGDLLGTGTISGARDASYGSLLEITRGGVEYIALPTGERRGFLEDGDEIILTARAEAPGRASIGLGECRARVLPARAGTA